MIFDAGSLTPLKRQVALIKEYADESFCTNVPEDFGPVPLIAGYTFCQRELTALSLKNVEPHDDPWVGDHQDDDGEDGPDGRRAMFWILKAPEDLFLQCGTMSSRMKSGSWVMFDDRILHGVYSTKKWFGLAWQLRPSGVALPASDSR